jgi:hypothetical protein
MIGFGMLLERSAGSLNEDQLLYLRKLNQGCQQLLALINQTRDPHADPEEGR